MKSQVSGCGFCAVILLSFASPAAVASIIPVTLPNALMSCDDCFSAAVPLDIDGAGGIDLFGVPVTQIYIDTNGYVTFDTGQTTYTPTSLTTYTGQPIIAPFYADVDTRGTGTVTYGNAVIDGVNAFVADWNAVGYYSAQTDKTDTFQLILYDESAIAPGDFDIQFNYGLMQWETGAASGGTDGLGGTSAVAGFSNGVGGAGNESFQLPGSLVPGSLINGGPDSLQTMGSMTFNVQNGMVTATTIPEPATFVMAALALLGLAALRRLRIH
jgi:hypothetical protein